ncbi:MAG: hypothetical protein GY765_25430, partial [bacterium]|nr:hypothetical protein [bacterium]
MNAINVIEVILNLNTKRAAGIGCTLRGDLHRIYKTTPGAVYQQLGLDHKTMTVEMMFNKSDAAKYLLSEVLRDLIVMGMDIHNFEDYLFGAVTDTTEKIQEIPYLDMSGMTEKKLKQRAPASTMRETEIDFRTKYVSTKEFGEAFKFPYTFNQIAKLKLNVLPLFFKGFI